MCDGIRERPRPGAELFCFWQEEGPIPEEQEERDFDLGEWTLRVRILKVKDSHYAPGRKYVTMEVIG